jgi:adenine/guanine phosphoribosyltransferase-like PRPP-binding protein
LAVHSIYLTKIFEPSNFEVVVEEAIDFLAPKTDEFDAIAFCGASGSLVAPVLAYTLNKSMIVVRKLKEIRSHSCLEVEGRDCKRFLIVDDFSSTGTTIEHILAKIKASSISGKPVGIYLWDARYGNKGCVRDVPIWNPYNK